MTIVPQQVEKTLEAITDTPPCDAMPVTAAFQDENQAVAEATISEPALTKLPALAALAKHRRKREGARARVQLVEVPAAAVGHTPIDLRALKLLAKPTPYEKLLDRIGRLEQRAAVLLEKERTAALQWMRQAVRDYDVSPQELRLA